MTETQINKQLKEARLLAEQYYAQGKPEIGQQILALASKFALFYLENTEIRGKIHCRSCGRVLNLGKEIEFYANIGSCYNCDDAYVQSMEEAYYYAH